MAHSDYFRLALPFWGQHTVHGEIPFSPIHSDIHSAIQRPSEMTAGRACFAVVEPLRGSAGSPVATGFMWQLIAAKDIS